MNAYSTFRQSAVAALAVGVVLFSLASLDSTLSPKNYAANATTQTTAQV
jgi:hypothetical protein